MQKNNVDYIAYKNKNFTFGEKVTVQRTRCVLDGMIFTVVGIASDGLMTHYILETLPGIMIPGHGLWKCFQITEACIDRVENLDKLEG